MSEPRILSIVEATPPDAMDRIAYFADLKAHKATLEAELRHVEEEIAKVEPSLLDWYAENGTQSIKANGATVYLHRQLWARPAEGDWGRAVRAAKAAGLSDLVQERFNLNTMSAWVREREAAGESLPASFEGAISVAEEFSLRVRRG